MCCSTRLLSKTLNATPATPSLTAWAATLAGFSCCHQAEQMGYWETETRDRVNIVLPHTEREGTHTTTPLANSARVARAADVWQR